MHIGTCKHFTSLNDRRCALGVPYSGVKQPGAALACFDAQTSLCDLRCEPTAAEVLEFDRKHKAETDAFLATVAERFAKLEPLLTRIRQKYRGRQMTGTASCPVCGGVKTLSIVHSGRNGHIHAFCSTENCVRFME